MSADPIDLAMASTEDLLGTYAHYVKLLESTEHWGRQKRFTRQRDRVVEELKARTNGTPRLLLPLREHPDPIVQLSAAILCRSLDPDGYREIVQALAQSGGPIGQQARDTLATDEWYEKHPPRPPGPSHPTLYWRSATEVPTGITRVALEERVRLEFSDDLARGVLELAERAIGAWPRQLREGADPRASCLGGLPLVPRDWTWPTLDGEPMLFVGHFNCADLASLGGASAFPTTGIIAIFGEHDHLHCCTAGRNGEGAAIFHWPDIDSLVPTSEPIADFEPLPRCGLAFYDTYSLPDPLSEEIDRFPFDRDQRRRYRELHVGVRGHGTNDRFFGELDVIKLLGWPDLVQCDLFPGPGGERLLLLFQLGDYDNGVTRQDWGPGGAVYFTISEADLAERRFDRVRLESQIT